MSLHNGPVPTLTMRTVLVPTPVTL
jgi:hypothetical protein